MRNKGKNNLELVVKALTLVAIIIFLWWLLIAEKDNHIGLKVEDDINPTPEQIQSIKAIGEWEFLSISDEEMVDTIRKGIFSDDHLVRIYYGTMRLGINLKQVESGWISTNGDTLNIMLPQIALLDKDFIDEARTKSFFESGSWSPKDREAMMRRAYQRMLQRGLTPQNMEAARVNGDAQVRQVMQGMGFKHVKIQYKD
jgi:hypothetical protein